jgi:hypothetical protein
MDTAGVGPGTAGNALTKPVPFNAEEPLPDFDWNQLYRRFEDRLQSCEAEEAQLSEDLNRLMAVGLLACWKHI